jgi:hypothetical protein
VRRLTPVLVLLRAAGLAALLLLFWNPTTAREIPGGDRPLVLLDASLSMTGAPWRAALDTAQAIARAGHGLIWRFGDRVAAFDTAPPGDGASRLGPALDAAAARGGPLVVVTDGALSDTADLPADLRARARVIVLPRSASFDAFVASVSGPRRLMAGDTLVLRVTLGTAGKRERGAGKGTAVLAVSSGGRRLASQQVSLPDSGTITTGITLPPSRLPPPGWSALEVRLSHVPGDAEPRDDARWLVVEVSAQPAAVVLGSPPDWESRFLARVLGDVARVPLKLYVETEPGRWRDGATLSPVSAVEVARATAGARLVALVGGPARFAAFRMSGGVLSFVAEGGGGGGGGSREGDWYADPPSPSPLTGALAGIIWDSLPPLAAVADLPPDSTAVPVIAARLARRGAPRPVVVLSESPGGRRATVAAAGLWRWAFRGGASEQAYRSLVAALADFLLGERGARGGARVVPVTYETPNGLPLRWRWNGRGAAEDVAITLTDGRGERSDTLRFDAGGQTELRLPPGVYRYALRGSGGQGVVVVEEYSDEWRPATPALRAQPGVSVARLQSTGLRDRWWLFVVAIAAFAAEWAWRRRHGLP